MIPFLTYILGGATAVAISEFSKKKMAEGGEIEYVSPYLKEFYEGKEHFFDILEFAEKEYPEILNILLPYKYSCTKRKIDETNFYISTKAQFKKLFWGKIGFEEFKKMLENKELQYINPKNSRSHYFIDKKNKLVYRYSDHWYRVGTCLWSLVPDMTEWQYLQKEYALGVCPFSDFEDIGYEYYIENKKSIFLIYIVNILVQKKRGIKIEPYEKIIEEYNKKKFKKGGLFRNDSATGGNLFVVYFDLNGKRKKMSFNVSTETTAKSSLKYIYPEAKNIQVKKVY